MTGKEEGMFVASGTMGNQASIMVHTRKCDTVICEASAHIYGSEAGAICRTVRRAAAAGRRGSWEIDA